MMNIEKLYEDPDGYIGRYYDPTSQVWILAAEVNNWSLSIYKRWIKVVAWVLSTYPETYFSLVKGEKEKKFNELFGFTSTGLSTAEGYEVMYVRS